MATVKELESYCKKTDIIQFEFLKTILADKWKKCFGRRAKMGVGAPVRKLIMQQSRQEGTVLKMGGNQFMIYVGHKVSRTC